MPHADVAKPAALPGVTRWPLGWIALYGVAAVLCVWWFDPVFYRMTVGGDFPAHIRFAQAIAESGRITIPHFGFELAVMVMHAIRPAAGWNSAAYVVAMIGQLATVVILARWMAASLPQAAGAVRLGSAALIAFLLLLVQPALMLTSTVRDPWLFGYFPPNQYHNPTTLLSKPLALALFAFGASAVSGAPGRGVAAGVALVIVSGIVKPSFLLAFLPAVCALALWHRHLARWRLVVAGMCVPAVLLLIAQYVLRYQLQAADGVSILFAPLMVIGLYTTTDTLTLATRLALSVLFPLAVALSFPGEAIRDVRLRLAWATFLAGIAPGYLLAEGGGKASAGDFLWSGQIAAFVLFAVSAAFLAARFGDGAGRQPGQGTRARAALCAGVFGWHAVSGILHLQRSWLE